MEHPDFRENLALLNQRFPDFDMLSTENIMRVYNCSRASVWRHFRDYMIDGKIAKVTLARLMCRRKAR